jgi:hypothetical protein
MRKLTIIAVFFLGWHICSAQRLALNVQWNNVTLVSKSTPTLQVVSNPMLSRTGSMHDGSFSALKDMGADYVRYVPWHVYPKLVVAELEPPTSKTTSWDFSLIDPMTIDFLNAAQGHSVILNFSTIPQWMFKTEHPVPYPADPNKVDWGYGGVGMELRDSTMTELTGYYTRLISWYTKGGFTDELGKYHKSGYHYELPYWEVLNEVEFEHYFSPQYYTKVYDAIVTAIHKISPKTKFIGMALANVDNTPDWFEYFLNPANHKPGVPLDMISYHCYASANPEQGLDAYQYPLFEKVDVFLNTVSYVESIRKRLSPKTKTDLDELGTFVSDQMRDQPIPPTYWNLSGAVYAYFFIGLTKLGIDVIGESQLVGFPGQYPDVTMIDYNNNKPNARYWVLKLIHDNIKTGDKLVQTGVNGDYWGGLAAQGFITGSGKKVLIINKRDKTFMMKLPPEFKGCEISTVDKDSGDNAPIPSLFTGDSIQIKPFSVSLIKVNTTNDRLPR